MSLKFFLLALLPLKAVLVQLVEANTFIATLNAAQFSNIILLGITLFFLGMSFQKIMASSTIRTIFVISIMLTFVLSLQPIFSFMFTQDIKDFGEIVKLFSWIFLIPLTAVVVKTEIDVDQLRLSAMTSFFLIVGSLAIANLYSFGKTAYKLGFFYMGWHQNEAPLSVALVMLTPLLLLPGRSQKERGIKFTAIVLIGLSFLLILLVMKRASILAIVLGLFIILALFKHHQRIQFSSRSFWIIVIAGLILSTVSIGYAVLEHSDAVNARFKDLEQYQKTGDVRYVGAGRAGLINLYITDFLNYSIPQKLFGVDITGNIDKRKGGYLHKGKKRAVPHNDFLEMLSRGGIIGLILYLLLWTQLLRQLVKQYRRAENPTSAHLAAIALGALSMYAIFSMDHTVFQILPMSAFGMLLGATLGLGTQQEPPHFMPSEHLEASLHNPRSFKKPRVIFH